MTRADPAPSVDQRAQAELIIRRSGTNVTLKDVMDATALAAEATGIEPGSDDHETLALGVLALIRSATITLPGGANA